MNEKDYAYLVPHGADPHAWIEAKRYTRELQVLVFLARGSCYLRDYINYLIGRFDYSESKVRADLKILKRYKLVRLVDRRASKRSYISVTSKGKLYISSKKIINSAVLSKNRITISQLNKAKALLYVDRTDRAAGPIRKIPPTWKAPNRLTSITERFSAVGRAQAREYFNKIEARRFYFRDYEMDPEGRLYLKCLAFNESENELDIFLKTNKWISEFMLLVENFNQTIVLDLVVVTSSKYDQIKRVAEHLIGDGVDDSVDKLVKRDKAVDKIMRRQHRKNKMDPDINPFGSDNILAKIDFDDPRSKILVVALKDI